MIFDAQQAIALYQQYRSGNVSKLSELHLLCNPLVEAVATAVCPDRRDDLIQEGHLKLLKLFQKGTYRPGKGDMYSFLSFALKNSMIDFLRKQKDYDDLPDSLCYEHSLGRNTVTNTTIWIVDRFPSYDPVLLNSINNYLHPAIAENIRSSKILNTLQLLYDLKRDEARIFHNSVQSYLRASAEEMHYAEAVKLAASNEKMEKSLLPELVLVLGIGNVKRLLLAMRGSYIRL